MLQTFLRAVVAFCSPVHLFSEMRTFYIAPNAQANYQNNLFVGQKPTRLFLGYVPVDAYQGSYQTNPMFFEPHDINYLCLRVDNRIVGQPLEMDWSSQSGGIRPYMELLKALRVLNRSIDVEPEFNYYPYGPLTLFGFDLSKGDA